MVPVSPANITAGIGLHFSISVYTQMALLYIEKSLLVIVFNLSNVYALDNDKVL